MIVTTSRKPSSRTRIFCKHLSRFTGWAYLTRGKKGLQGFAGEPFLLVGEYRGNPGSFSFFHHDECVLSIRANVSLDTDIDAGMEPIILGSNSLAFDLGRITGLRIGEESGRVIRVDDDIEFIEGGKSIIKLRVLEIRSKGSV